MPDDQPDVRPPQQERSRRAMMRVFEVTRELLEEGVFDDIPITEILRRSGQSPGQFYARFSGKDALFRELCRQFESEVHDRVVEEVESWEGLPLEDRIRRLVRLIAELNVEHRPILRSLMLRIWREPGRHRELGREIRSESFEELVLRELGSRDPVGESATARWAIEIVAVVCRHEFVFGVLEDATLDEPPARTLLALLTRIARDLIVGAHDAGREPIVERTPPSERQVEP